MFRQSITSTPLNDDVANSYFSNIRGDAYRNDNSMVVSLRALIHKRMPAEDSIIVRFDGCDYSIDDIVNDNDAFAKRLAGYIPDENGTYYIHDVRGDEETIVAAFNVLEQRFTEINEGWNHMEKIKIFYSKSFNVLCFTHPETKRVAIFIAKLDTRKLHYLQCSIFASLPWYYNPQDGISELEMTLVKSLRERTNEAYLNTVSTLADTFDLRQFRIKYLLNGFESKYERREMDRLRREITNCINSINRYNEEIGVMLKQKNDHELKLLGIETKIGREGDTSEIMEYFMCNKRLVLEAVTDDYMYFAVRDYITYFDEDAAARMIDNKSSYIYAGMSRYMEPEKMEKLMRAVFIDQILKIRTCAAYRFSLNGSVYPEQSHNFGSEFDGYLPNTHIDNYGCMGNYTRTINELLCKNDYIGALEQSIASCKSINFSDSTVMQRFMKILYGQDSSYSNKCIELPDGTVVNSEDAVAWLEAQENKEDIA